MGDAGIIGARLIELETAEQGRLLALVGKRVSRCGRVSVRESCRQLDE